MEQGTNCQLHVPLNNSHWSPARMVTRQSPYTSSGHRPMCSLTTPPLSSVRSAPQRRKAPFHSSPSSSLVPLLCSPLSPITLLALASHHRAASESRNPEPPSSSAQDSSSSRCPVSEGSQPHRRILRPSAEFFLSATTAPSVTAFIGHPST
jgi:hypothetical protein